MENRKNRALALAFGQVLRPIRKARRLTQTQLAAQAGISRAHVDWLERGHRVPTLTVLFAIAAVLRVNPERMVLETTKVLRYRKRLSVGLGMQIAKEPLRTCR